MKHILLHFFQGVCVCPCTDCTAHPTKNMIQCVCTGCNTPMCGLREPRSM